MSGLGCETLAVAGLGGVRVGVVEYVARAVAVADFEFECLARFGVGDRYREVAVMGVPEQLDVDAVALATVEFADRRDEAGAVGVGAVCADHVGSFGCAGGHVVPRRASVGGWRAARVAG